MNSTAAVADVHYPASDGMPMGETGWHITALFLLLDALRNHFAGRKDVYVASNMFLYYVEGDPRQNRAPDCMVIFGVPNLERPIFKTWEEGAVPSVIFELSSPGTIREDLDTKRSLYARLGVAEYYLFDPVGDCLDPTLQGLHLSEGSYASLTPEPDGGLTSPALGLRLVPEGQTLRLIDSRTRRPILTSREKSELIVAEARHARAEARRARAEARRAETESRRAEAEQQAAERERRRADELAAEVERLKILLNKRIEPRESNEEA